MNAKKHLTCPVCEGQNLSIGKKFEYTYRFTIKDGYMFNICNEVGRDTGVVWISCNDCRQTEDEVEWKATKVEKRLINDMIHKSANPIDISDLLKS